MKIFSLQHVFAIQYSCIMSEKKNTSTVFCWVSGGYVIRQGVLWVGGVDPEPCFPDSGYTCICATFQGLTVLPSDASHCRQARPTLHLCYSKNSKRVEGGDQNSPANLPFKWAMIAIKVGIAVEVFCPPAERTSNAFSYFWGCSTIPSCGSGEITCLHWPVGAGYFSTAGCTVASRGNKVSLYRGHTHMVNTEDTFLSSLLAAVLFWSMYNKSLVSFAGEICCVYTCASFIKYWCFFWVFLSWGSLKIHP